MYVLPALTKLGLKLANRTAHICASLVYATVEGFSFLLSPYGLGVVLSGEIVGYARKAGVGTVIAVAVKGAILCIVGRALHALSLEFQRHLNSTEDDSLLKDTVSESIWDWQPPENDSLSSGTWQILKEMVLTLQKLREAYPEVEQLLKLPELQPGELAPRLYYYYSAQESLPHPDLDVLEEGFEVETGDLFLLVKYREYAMFAYDKTEDSDLSESLSQFGYSLITARYRPDLQSGSPAFYLAITDGTEGKGGGRELLLCIRGTYSAEDVFTDLFANGTAFGRDGSAHAGMTKAASFLFNKFQALFNSFTGDGHKIVIVGHSLGAGIASLLALKLLEEGLDPSLFKAIAFEPPCCMDKNLAFTCSRQNIVLSVVNRDDMVPRLAITPFLNLLKDLVSFDWRKAQEETSAQAPIILRMVTALLQASKETNRQTDNTDISKTSIQDYDPVVPGKIVYISPGEMSSQMEEGSEPSTGSDFIQVEKYVRRVIPHDSPVLSRMRLTPHMIHDHFIDTNEFINILQS
eukprot:jgi/Picsp_1/6165/NSC_03519-R1_protein